MLIIDVLKEITLYVIMYHKDDKPIFLNLKCIIILDVFSQYFNNYVINHIPYKAHY